MDRIKSIILAIVSLTFVACASTEKTMQPVKLQNKDVHKKIVVFFDGTQNDETSRTNVSKLHSLISLQGRDDIHTIYIQGVGTRGEGESMVLGLAFGNGIERDVKQAYRFLSERYNSSSDDEVYVFGFSRGSHAARILAGLLSVAGIPNLDDLSVDAVDDTIDDIFAAHKGKKSKQERMAAIKALDVSPRANANIKFMGIWDTVEALGFPDPTENWSEFGGRLSTEYYDQLCNIERAAHAMSIDDFRAKIFTPTLLTYPELIKDCPDKDIHGFVNEVWFAGAHSDVGGGYLDTDLDGVSLNWMLGELRAFDLLPENASVYEDRLGLSHDARKGLWTLVFGQRNRHIPEYSKAGQYPDGLLPVHDSVIERLKNGNPGKRWFEFNWTGKGNYQQCFSTLDGGEAPDCFSKACNLVLRDDQKCFRIISTEYPVGK